MVVGRDGELRTIRELLGTGAPVVVRGPAGIGKSTVARAALADEPAARVTSALASQRWAPMAPIARLLRAQPAGPEPAARALLRAGTGPILLDDLQWADDATLEVLGLVADHVPLVLTVRDGRWTGEHDDEAARALAVAELLGAAVVALGPLDADDAADLLAQRHPDLRPDRRAAVLRAAEGNPLLLEQLPSGSSAASTLVSVLLERVDDLDPAPREALERLAALGRPATPDLLGPGTRALLDAGFAVRVEAPDGPDRPTEGGAVAVTHPLVAEILAEGLGDRLDRRRRELAALVSDAEAAQLLAAAGDRLGARRAALAAAEDPALDDRSRAELLALAVELADDLDPERRLAAARLFTRTSQPERAIALCAVPERDDLPPVARGALVAAEAEAAWMQGRTADTVALSEQALADLRGTDTIWEALVLAGSTVTATFLALDGRPALERVLEAAALADRLGEGRAYTRTRLASVLATSGDPTWADHYRRAVDLARQEGDPDQYRTTVVGQLLSTWTSGDVEEAERLARKELRREVPVGFDVSWLSVASYAALLGLLAGGAPREVEEEFAPILRDEPAFRHRPFLEAAVAVAAADAGHHRAADQLVSAALERPASDPQMRSLGLWAAIEVRWAAGRDADASDLVDPLLALGVGDYPSAVMGRLVGAHAARAVGREPVGPAPAALLPAWAAAPIEWEALAMAATDPATAADRMVEAADRWRGCDVRAELRCRWAAGDLLVADDPDRARRLLEEAEVGAALRPPMLDRVRRSLRAVGVVRRAPSSALGGLTAREVQVLELVAEGHRTGEIAAALSVAPSTVESLVRSAVAKLGVGTRTAAAAAVVGGSAAAPAGEGG